MSNLIEVGRTNELEDGSIKETLVRGRQILLARVGDKYYATENHCPHMGGKLSQGKLEDTVVTCPLHGSQFDLVNGQVVRWLKGSGLISKVSKVLRRPRPLIVYNVKVKNDRILMEI